MNPTQSFAATIQFALLALAMLFTANLVAAANYAGTSCIYGTVLAILATGAAYVAQHCFSHSGFWLAHHQATTVPGYAGPAHPDAWDMHEMHHVRGLGLQIVAAVCAVASGVLFLAGAL